MNLREGRNHQDTFEKNEVEQACQRMSQTIDDFKQSVLNSVRLQVESRNQRQGTENLQEWVTREFSPVDPSPIPGETLEQWVIRQKLQLEEAKPARSLLGKLEQWIDNEIRKDAIKMIETEYAYPAQLSGREIRELAAKLNALADKLDQK